MRLEAQRVLNMARKKFVNAAEMPTNKFVVTSSDRTLTAIDIGPEDLVLNSGFVVVVAAAEYEVSTADNGKFILFTNPEGCSVTLDGDAASGVNVLLCRGIDAGTVTIASDGQAVVVFPVGSIGEIDVGAGQAGAVVVSKPDGGVATWYVEGRLTAAAV